MVALPNMESDPTIEAMFAIMEKIEADKPRRAYLGASSIGEECERKLWYQYNGYPRPSMDRKGICATEDGHRTEDLIAARLRLVPGIELYTHTEDGGQFGFSKHEGRVKGHYDGVIRGLLQAPKAWHIWENKACGEKNFNKFQKCIDDYGSKQALKNWNTVYYGQAQMAMGEEKIDRHYLTVSLAGGRDLISCRTEFDRDYYESLDRKALRVITTKTAPARISENPTFFKCKFCDYAGSVCHGK